MTPKDTAPCLRCSQEDRIREIHEALIGTAEKEGLASVVRRNDTDMKRLRETVYGNGHIGLTESVRLHHWILGVVGTGVGALVIKAGYDLFRYYLVK